MAIVGADPGSVSAPTGECQRYFVTGPKIFARPCYFFDRESVSALDSKFGFRRTGDASHVEGKVIRIGGSGQRSLVGDGFG